MIWSPANPGSRPTFRFSPVRPCEYSKTYLKEFPGREVKITYDKVPLDTWCLINVHFSRGLSSGTKSLPG